MNKQFYIATLLAALMLFAASCNKDDDDNTTTIIYTSSSTSMLVSNFALQANSNVLDNLDSVFFSIDADAGRIYNADSLPVGTDVSHLLTTLTFKATVGTVRYLTAYEKDGAIVRDTIEYSSSSTDSINFTGAVTLEVSSPDGELVKRYDVKVNVHQLEPDTLVWPMTARRDLPGSADDNLAQRTVQWGERVACLLRTRNDYRLSVGNTPEGPWTTTKADSWGFTPNVNTLAATSETLYVLDTEGNLHYSTDGSAWTTAPISWSVILGTYDNRVLGITPGSNAMLDEWPRREGFEPMTLPANFPISGMSPMVQASNEWAVSQQSMMVGGVLQSGAVSNAVWGYDGDTWGQIDNHLNTLPALQGATLVSYYSHNVSSSNFKATRQLTWLIFGGTLQDGTLNRTTYASTNQGITWSVAGSGMQLPEHVPGMVGAQALVYTTTFTAAQAASRRVSKLVTEWECPCIYLFGGTDATGTKLLNNVWRGTINRLMFKPIY